MNDIEKLKESINENKKKEISFDNKKRNEKILIISIIVIIILVIIGIIYGSITFVLKVYLPNQKYNKAKEFISKEDFEQAISILEKLPTDYKDTSNILSDSYRSYANQLSDSEDFEKAFSIYEKINLSTTDIEMQEMLYKYASFLASKEQYEEAYNQYIKIGNYKNSSESAKEVALKYGDTLLIQQQYKEAIKWYELSKNEEKIKESKIKYGDVLLNEEKYEEAIQLYNEVNATESINNAKYAYVQKNNNNEDATTYQYLVDLIKNNYSDSINIYNNLYNIQAVLLINYTKEDEVSNLSTIKQYDNGYRKLYAHYKIIGNIPGNKVKLKTVYETRWGYDGVVKEDWKQNKYFSNESLETSINEWKIGYLDMASNLYYHRVIIYNADTGQKLAESKSVYTPYNR